MTMLEHKAGRMMLVYGIDAIFVHLVFLQLNLEYSDQPLYQTPNVLISLYLHLL